MSQKCRETELRGKKRRSCNGGGAIERKGEAGVGGGVGVGARLGLGVGVIGGTVASQAWTGEMDSMLEALVKETDIGLLSCAVERVLLKQKSEVEKSQFLEKSLSFGLQLQDVANKLARQHAAHHNFVAWPLTQDLTVKVFSLLGTQSLCQAAASCNMFNKLAMDPACYVDVDLTTRGGPSKVSNRTVSKIVQRAGQCLRSLKLGALPRQNRAPSMIYGPRMYVGKASGSPISIGLTTDKVLPSRCIGGLYPELLTRNCLEPLTEHHGIAGTLLTKLYLFNIDQLDSKYLSKAIAACPALLDLEVVGLPISIRTLMECVGSNCPNLTRLCCQPGKSSISEWGQNMVESIKTGACNQLVKGCTNISYLALRRYGVADQRANILVKGLPKLTVVDFSGAYKLTGVFLRGIVGTADEPSLLETILLRDCIRLKEVEVERFMCMLITGECKNLRLLDISNKGGLAARDWFDRRLSPDTENVISRVRQERTELCLLAEFPDHKSDESDSHNSSFDDSDDSGPPGLHSSDSETSSSDIDSEEDDDDDDDDDDSGPDLGQADSDISMSLELSDDLEDRLVPPENHRWHDLDVHPAESENLWPESDGAS